MAYYTHPVSVTSSTASFFGAITRFVIVITVGLASTLSPAFADFEHFLKSPVLPPSAEVAYQAALHPLAPAPTVDATLNKRLAEADVRSNLQHTEWLHNDRG
jgi:hypothetical protein